MGQVQRLGSQICPSKWGPNGDVELSSGPEHSWGRAGQLQVSEGPATWCHTTQTRGRWTEGTAAQGHRGRLLTCPGPWGAHGVGCSGGSSGLFKRKSSTAYSTNFPPSPSHGTSPDHRSSVAHPKRYFLLIELTKINGCNLDSLTPDGYSVGCCHVFLFENLREKRSVLLTT